MKDPAIKALYQKAAKGGQATYTVALRDAMIPLSLMVYTSMAKRKRTADDLISVKAKKIPLGISKSCHLFAGLRLIGAERCSHQRKGLTFLDHRGN
ncbi:hypothetical protein [Chitinophaga filiformis]|uniref:Uncharacterized protein n=1 Tax=Chitinophaga filiformis TaxID=104663 RepID=A0ABY4HY67_CHIFI|nr:hypothetical protein [Chitinophaga filiformis]UPK67898.1 hypothetical protein MYF79_23380 [Chitinophaga filiformis]